ncbi:MAG: SH3 domain-containing protein [Alphaproteobacteria bacterium]
MILLSSFDNAWAAEEKLPLPRFVSLRSEEVNVRTGPGVRYPINWVFHKRDLPVEIVAEFENWRKVRDVDHAEGWVHQSMLSGRRSIVISGTIQDLKSEPAITASTLAQLEPGVIGRLEKCEGVWCKINTAGYKGWLERTALWGIYPNEQIK